MNEIEGLKCKDCIYHNDSCFFQVDQEPLVVACTYGKPKGEEE